MLFWIIMCVSGYFILGFTVMILELRFNKTWKGQNIVEAGLIWVAWPLFIASHVFEWVSKRINQFMTWVVRLAVPEERR